MPRPPAPSFFHAGRWRAVTGLAGLAGPAAWAHGIALGGLLLASAGCRHQEQSQSHPDAAERRLATAAERAPEDRDRRPWTPWPGRPVADPWDRLTQPGAPALAAVSAEQRAVEDLGPSEPEEVPPDTRAGGVADPARQARFVSTNAVYWTDRVGLPFRRDVDLDLDDVPVDLDGDGRPDTHVTRHVHLRGGILANPGVFGLVATPEDPAGRRGAISASTGVLGLREELDDQGRPSGRIGMSCFICHGARNAVDGRVVLGLANPRFDYGLLLATARALGDEPADVSYRRTHGFPDGTLVRARLLMAGPGRQDLTGEFGLDVTVPHVRSMQYPGTARVRQKTRGVVNPLSVPSALGVAGVDLQNWSGSEIASLRWLTRLEALTNLTRAEVVSTFALPAPEPGPAGDDTSATRRALLLDLRNLGTLGLQQDSWPGLLFADAVYGTLPRAPATERSAAAAARSTTGAATVDHAALALPTPADLARLPRLYAAAEIRATLAKSEADLARPRGEPSAVARGRRLFFDEPAGTIANLRVLKEAPRAYASSHLEGPVLAPLFAGRALGERLLVRCGDCHSATPHEALRPFTDNPSPSGRCTSCHRAHSQGADASLDAELTRIVGRARDDAAPTWPLDVFLSRRAAAETSFCMGCHTRHRTFAPIAFSNSALLPFDADRDGRAQDDERDDGAAGGIGTEALLAFDVPSSERGPDGFHLPVAVIDDARHAGPVHTEALGVPWVRVPPLIAVFATAPYLHNGAVPTLAALLTPPAKRPRTFALGETGFVFDTRLAGNRAFGHDFGTRWTGRQKRDLIAFLRSL